MEPDYDQHSVDESFSKVAAKNESIAAVSPDQQKRYFSSMKPPVPGQRYKSTAMLPAAAAGFDRVEESEMSMMINNNAKRTGGIGGNAHLNNDLNMSGIVDMRIRLSSAVNSRKITSRSMTRMQSNRSVRSQKSLEALEKGWSHKYKKGKALEDKQVAPLHRLPSAGKKNGNLNASPVAN